MLVKRLSALKKIISGDGCTLKEIVGAKVTHNYSVAHAILPKGKSSRKHKLKASAEAYYILQGKGVMYINKESKEVKKDDLIYIPPAAIQHIENTGKKDLVFLCIVDPAWRKGDESIL